MNRHAQLKDIAAASPIQPPRTGEAERDAINAIIDGGLQFLCGNLADLHQRLNDLEQQALVRAADAKAMLNETVSVCIKIGDEVAHTKAVIAEIEARGRDE